MLYHSKSHIYCGKIGDIRRFSVIKMRIKKPPNALIYNVSAVLFFIGGEHGTRTHGALLKPSVFNVGRGRSHTPFHIIKPSPSIMPGPFAPTPHNSVSGCGFPLLYHGLVNRSSQMSESVDEI